MFDLKRKYSIRYLMLFLRLFQLTAKYFRIACVSANAHADTLVIRGITERLDSAFLLQAGVYASLRCQLTVLVIGTIVVLFTLWFTRGDAVALGVETVAKFGGTDAVSAVVDDKAAFQSADAVTTFVYLKTFFDGTEDTFVVFIKGCLGRANAFAVWASYEAFIGSAEFHWKEKTNLYHRYHQFSL